MFESEERLYGCDKKKNHRLHPMYKYIEAQIFNEDEWDESLLYPLLSSGVTAMHEKLCTYADSHAVAWRRLLHSKNGSMNIIPFWYDIHTFSFHTIGMNAMWYE